MNKSISLALSLNISIYIIFNLIPPLRPLIKSSFPLNTFNYYHHKYKLFLDLPYISYLILIFPFHIVFYLYHISSYEYIQFMLLFHFLTTIICLLGPSNHLFYSNELKSLVHLVIYSYNYRLINIYFFHLGSSI